MWSLLKSPLILGNDVTNMVRIPDRARTDTDDAFPQTNETLTIITNKAIIDINQVCCDGGHLPNLVLTERPGREWLAGQPHVEADGQRGRGPVALGRKPGEQVRTCAPTIRLLPDIYHPSAFVFALLNTSPAEQTVYVDFVDVFFDQVRKL